MYKRQAFNSVLINDAEAAAEAVEYLAQKGHKKIGYLRGDFRIQAFCSREMGYYQVMNRRGLEVKPEYIATVGTKIETAYESMKKYLNETKEIPTAFFADNDVIAIGSMQAMKECGYEIPKDISVIGFDNVSYGMVSDPPLSTMHVYKQELGERAVREMCIRDRNEQILDAWIHLTTAINNERIVSEMPLNEALICRILYKNQEKMCIRDSGYISSVNLRMR